MVCWLCLRCSKLMSVRGVEMRLPECLACEAGKPTDELRLLLQVRGKYICVPLFYAFSKMYL